MCQKQALRTLLDAAQEIESRKQVSPARSTLSHQASPHKGHLVHPLDSPLTVPRLSELPAGKDIDPLPLQWPGQAQGTQNA